MNVSDLKRSADFYESFLGLKVIEKNADTLMLSADGKQPYLVFLSQAKQNDLTRRAGLYHFAMLLPQRVDLAGFLSHLLEHKDRVRIDGFANHLVSEALYIRDPDHIGIEIYCDRPQSEWRWTDNQIRMGVDPLDVEGLLSEHAERWAQFPAETTIGHVHLHVSNLSKARQFYSEILGLSNTAGMQGALFFAAGNYHHHIAANVWLGEGIQKASHSSAGLDHFTIKLPSKNSLEGILRRVESKKIPVEQDGDSFFMCDWDGIRMRLCRA